MYTTQAQVNEYKLLNGIFNQENSWLINQCTNQWYNKEQEQFCRCGKCSTCRKKALHALACRIYCEAKDAMTMMFITCTYETKHLPHRNGITSLDKKEVPKFIREVRHFLDGKKIRGQKIRADFKAEYDKYCKSGHNLKYLNAGEYGTKNTLRPHYHLVLFNLPVGLESKIEQIWFKGDCQIKNVAPGDEHGAVQYVIKYALKDGADSSFYKPQKRAAAQWNREQDKLAKEDPNYIPEYVEDGMTLIQRPFRTMTPSLGYNYIKKILTFLHSSCSSLNSSIVMLDRKSVV